MNVITESDFDELIASRWLSIYPVSGIVRWRATRGKARCGAEAGRADRDGYIRIGAMGRHVSRSRLIFYYVHGWLPPIIDHINRNRADDRIINLRPATKVENARNGGISKNNTSGYLGVCRGSGCNTWRAHINVRGRQRTAYFATKAEAVAQRTRWEHEIFKEFAPSAR